MSKIDWERMYKGALRGSRGKYGSFKQIMHQRQTQAAEAQRNAEVFQKMQPLLRKSLFDHLIHRKPIVVKAPIDYHYEQFIKGGMHGVGVAKGQIPAGTVLTFVQLEKSLGQWIFTDQKGTEYPLYSGEQIVLPGPQNTQHQVPNPAFWGLLTRTDIYTNLMEALNAAPKG